MRTVAVKSLVNLLWNVSWVLEEPDSLVIIANSEELSQRIPTNSIDIG
jgi:hypothetical protein